MSDATGPISFGRLLKVLLPIAVILLAFRYSLPSVFEKPAQQQLEANMLQRLLGDTLSPPADTVKFADSDGDLLCDPPAESASPEKLVFTYIAAPEDAEESAVWADLTAAIGEATGLPVEYAHFTSMNDQLAAMARGELHICGANTGAVPLAVESAGFHPVCTQGNAEGEFGYTMKLLVPSASAAQDPKGLAGKKLAFTRPDSNSGFKAAVIYLMGEHSLQPERDYQWGFTAGHDTSILEVANRTHDAAPVASDILERMTNDGEVAPDAFRVIYESERFPPATIGYSHTLSEELRTKIAETLLAFNWEGTSVAEKYAASGAEKFVPVSYKDDWANIRRIDEAIQSAKEGE